MASRKEKDNICNIAERARKKGVKENGAQMQSGSIDRGKDVEQQVRSDDQFNNLFSVCCGHFSCWRSPSANLTKSIVASSTHSLILRLHSNSFSNE